MRQVLDSYVTATIPCTRTVEFVKNNPKEERCGVFPAPAHDLQECVKRWAFQCAETQIHVHSHTCHKLPNGLYCCRMGFSRPANPFCTRPVYYKLDEANFIEAYVEDDCPPTCNHQQAPYDPHPPIDSRQVTWVLFRLESDVYFVETSRLLGLATGGNSNVSLVTGIVNAMKSIFYQSNYMGKDGDGILQQILPCIQAAFQKQSNYPSIAEDSGTDFRNHVSLIQKLMHSVNSLQESSAQMMALMILGTPSNIYSDTFGYVDVHATTNYMVQHFGTDMHIIAGTAQSDMSNSDSDTSHSDSASAGTDSDPDYNAQFQDGPTSNIDYGNGLHIYIYVHHFLTIFFNQFIIWQIICQRKMYLKQVYYLKILKEKSSPSKTSIFGIIAGRR